MKLPKPLQIPLLIRYGELYYLYIYIVIKHSNNNDNNNENNNDKIRKYTIYREMLLGAFYIP